MAVWDNMINDVSIKILNITKDEYVVRYFKRIPKIYYYDYKDICQVLSVFFYIETCF